MSVDFSWDGLRAFAAVAREGSLTSAAQRLGLSQPTVGRHVQALEAQLAVQLFSRGPRGLSLTSTGLELLEHASAMAESADRLGLAAQGRAETLAGVVRITASELVATYTLPPLLVALRQAEPEIDIELVASNATDNLLQREADIAVRMYRPTQADVITRNVGAFEMGVYAAESYLERRGCPSSLDELLEHDIIGYDRSTEIIEGFRAAGHEVERSFFPFRCDDQVVAWQMVVAGYGIGFTQRFIGEREPRVRRILAELPIAPLPVWLTAHAELKTSRRIRRVFDFLASALAELLAQ